MINVIESKLSELDKLQDPILPQGIDIHCFEMKKVGKGWKTMNYNWHNNGILDPYIIEQVLPQHSTLSKIRKDFVVTLPNHYVICVIDGNLVAPSCIFQLIVECRNQNQYNEVVNILQDQPGLNSNCLLEYKWVDEIPSSVLKSLLEY